jgi:chromosome segregation ATPase
MTIEAPAPHAVKKTERLTTERMKLQQQIDAVIAKHEADLAALRQVVEREKTTVAVLELGRNELAESITQRRVRIEELEQQVAEERAGLAEACVELAVRNDTLTDCRGVLAKAQQAFDARNDQPKRKIAALEKKRDNVDRRLQLHQAREPLPALFPGKRIA